MLAEASGPAKERRRGNGGDGEPNPSTVANRGSAIQVEAAPTPRPFEAAVAGTAGAVSPLPATERSMRAFIFAIAPPAGARSSVMTGTLAQNSS